MGTWGSGPFDNDDAADWAWTLTADADERVVALALAPDLEDSPDPVVIAAAEVVAAAIDRPHPELPEEVASWIAARRHRPWAELAPLAAGAVRRLRGASEGDERWEGSGDEAWRFEADDLLARLATAD